MRSFDLSRRFVKLNYNKDNLAFMELALTRIDCPFNSIFWTKVREPKALVDEDGNNFFANHDDSFVTDDNVKYTETQFVKMPFPFKKIEE